MKTKKNLEQFVKSLALVSKGNRAKISGIHLPSIEFALRPHREVLQNKTLKKLSVSETKSVPYVMQNQDLHLLQLQKIYLETKVSLKGVSLWKLPKKRVAERCIREAGRQTGINPESVKKHLVTWLTQAKHDDEKTIQEHLELQKQRKESRNYTTNKPLFQ